MVRGRSGIAGRGGAAGPQKSVDAGIPRDIQPCGDGGGFAAIYVRQVQAQQAMTVLCPCEGKPQTWSALRWLRRPAQAKR